MSPWPQNIAVPLSYDTEKTAAPLKRYVAQLLKVSADAGFEAPMAEVSKKLSDKVQTAESVKEFLMRCEPYMSPDFYAALSEALVAVEAKIGGSVMFGANPGYKAFTDQVKEVAKRSGINWQLLAAAGAPPKDAAAAAAVARDLHAYAQSAMVADAKADVDALRAEATALLDKHLSKTADQVRWRGAAVSCELRGAFPAALVRLSLFWDNITQAAGLALPPLSVASVACAALQCACALTAQVRKEQSAAMAAMMKKLEASKGAKWAEQFAKDLKYVSWYDGAVAANPTAGPKAATA